MKAKEIVNKINKLIKDVNITTSTSVLGRMEILPKNVQTTFRDELSSLINNYEMQNVEIGKICFLGGYKAIDSFLFFGNIDMDFLGVDRKTKEIILADHDDVSFVMMKCAVDSNAFLNVLTFYAEFVIKSIQSSKPSVNFEDLYKMSGGDAYKNFIDYLFA